MDLSPIQSNDPFSSEGETAMRGLLLPHRKKLCWFCRRELAALRGIWPWFCCPLQQSPAGKLREKHWSSIGQVLVCNGYTMLHVSFGWMDGLCHTKKSILKARENAMIIVRLRSNSRASARITLLPARRSVVACYYQGNGGQKHPGIFRIRGRFRGFCGPYAWRNHLWLGQIHGFKPWMLRVGLNIIKLGWFKMVQTCSN